jgi:hypothetical protein
MSATGVAETAESTNLKACPPTFAKCAKQHYFGYAAITKTHYPQTWALIKIIVRLCHPKVGKSVTFGLLAHGLDCSPKAYLLTYFTVLIPVILLYKYM